MNFTSFLVFFTILAVGNGYKILAIFPFGSFSHYSIGESTLKALTDVGHEVTIISSLKTKKPQENFKEIIIDDPMKEMMKEQSWNAFQFAQTMPSIFAEFFLFGMGATTIEAVMENEDVKNLMNSDEKFDAVFVEIFAVEAFMGFGQRFNCPVIGVTTFDAVYWNDVLTGNASPYSFVPMVFYGLPDQMTYGQRLANTIFSLMETVAYNVYHVPKQRKLYEKYFPGAKASFDEARKNISLIFMNSHVSSSAARPLMPNMIGIAGIHVVPAKPLPKDIKDFLDSADNGAILFSMGSATQSTDWSPEKRDAMVKVFERLKEKVLWKYENETLPGNPGNIKIGKWIPQRDILAHPNVKLFITHGGQCGTTEALYEGVPLLAIPLFGDQIMNVNRAVLKGYALTLDFQELTEESFENALKELLTNPRYANNARRLSKITKDRPLTPQQTVVYWTEHVIRHEGGDHLKSVARNLSFIEYYLIDVYATLAVATLLGFYVFIKILKRIFKAKSGKSGKTSTKKQKKQ